MYRVSSSPHTPASTGSPSYTDGRDVPHSPLPQQTFEFMEPSVGEAVSPTKQDSRQQHSRSQHTRQQRFRQINADASTKKPPKFSFGKTGLLFPLEPHVRVTTKTKPALEAVIEPASEPAATITATKQTLIEKLRLQTKSLSVSEASNRRTFVTGCSALDHTLLRSGFRCDAISEWVADSKGSGAAALSMVVAAHALRVHESNGPIVIVDAKKTFYPPAAAALGIPPERMILIRPLKHADFIWAIDQALRCEAVAAVWAEVDTRLDDRDARRFQLAAEQGQTAGFFVRPIAQRGKPSFAEVRLHVKKGTGLTWANPEILKHNTPLCVTLDRGRGNAASQGGTLEKSVWIQIDAQSRLIEVPAPQETKHETPVMPLVAELAHPKRAASRRQSQGQSKQHRA